MQTPLFANAPALCNAVGPALVHFGPNAMCVSPQLCVWWTIIFAATALYLEQTILWCTGVGRCSAKISSKLETSPATGSHPLHCPIEI